MIVIKNKIIPFGGYSCINLLGIVFTKKDMDWRDYNHELLHSHQMLECMFFTVGLVMGLIALFDISPWWFLISPFSFYIYYGLEYLLIRAFHKKQNGAYHDVSFEEEAYNNADNYRYISERKWFGWIKYLKIKSYGKS